MKLRKFIFYTIWLNFSSIEFLLANVGIAVRGLVDLADKKVRGFGLNVRRKESSRKFSGGEATFSRMNRRDFGGR